MLFRETRVRETTALSQRLKKALICWGSNESQDEDDSGTSPPPIPSDRRYEPAVPPIYEPSAVMPPRYRFPSPSPSPPPSYEASIAPGYDAAVHQRPTRRITSKKLPPREPQRPTAPSVPSTTAVAGRKVGSAVNRRHSATRPAARNTRPALVARAITRPITPEPPPTTSSSSFSPLAATAIVTEVIDAVFVQGGTVSRVERRGYLSLYFQANAIGALPRAASDGSLKFVLNNAAAVDCNTSARNVQLRRKLHDTPTRKIFVVHHRDLVSHLRQLHEDDPSADFYRATVAKYEIRTSVRDSSVCPLTLSALWLKESATLVSLQMYYAPNASAVHPSTQPLEELELLVKVPSMWRLSISYPLVTNSTDDGVTWSISKLEQRRNLLAAKFQLDSSYTGKYKGEVSARFRCSGATLSGVKLEVVQHVANAWPIRDVRMQLKSGNLYVTHK